MNIPKIASLDVQAQIYLYAFYRAQSDLGIKFAPEDLSFVFVQTPSLNESRVDFSKELYERFEEDFLSEIKAMQNCKAPISTQDKPACKFCEYRFMCQKG